MLPAATEFSEIVRKARIRETSVAQLVPARQYSLRFGGLKACGE
jgi:hypothetical protein